MKLVKLSDHGIKSIQYYWDRRDKFNISVEELNAIGIYDNSAFVDERLVPLLKKANEQFKTHGFEIIVKDGYRSPELYDLARRKRYENEGKEVTDKVLHATRQPHSTGLAIDINFLSLETGDEIRTWDNKDWPEGAFVDFYKNKDDAKSREFQRLQVLMREVMLGLGFKLGTLNEYWHFELE